MGFLSFVNELRFDFNCVRAKIHSGRGRIDRARERIDAAFALEEDPPHYLLAFDARLMMQEGRHKEVLTRLRECFAILQEDMDLEEHYVRLHCRLMVGLYDPECGYEELEELRVKAANLKVSGAVKYLLPVISKSSFLKLFVDKTPLDQKFSWKSGPVIPSLIEYDASFGQPIVGVKSDR